ncbi:MAG: DMT family transporter [Planktomarina sp.]|nr:DMT family transporter [Planktomarina sp.]
MRAISMPLDNPRLGVFMMIIFCVFAPASDALVKVLGDSIPLLQVLIARFAAQLFLIRRKTWTTRHETWKRRDLIGLIILRSILHLIAIGFFFLALRYLPLADALAIAYVLPFFILGVGWFSGEKATPLVLSLCTLGFVGTLLVVQPSFAKVGWPATLPILVAAIFTGFMFITRKISKHIDPIDLQAINGVCVLAILLPIAWFGKTAEISMLTMVAIDSFELLCLIGVGVLGTIAHLMMTWSLRFASAPTVAPVQYLEIPFGALFGWIIFSDLPNGLAAFGIILTMAAGLLVLHFSKT